LILKNIFEEGYWGRDLECRDLDFNESIKSDGDFLTQLIERSISHYGE